MNVLIDLHPHHWNWFCVKTRRNAISFELASKTHGKNGFVTATKLGTTVKFFVAAAKNFAAATKRFVDRTKHFVVVTTFLLSLF